MSDAGLLRADAVIVGGGLAGLWAALHLPSDWDVVVVDKGSGPDLGSSPWAQGGMAVAAGPDDSPQLHATDTIRAGAGLCDERAVEVLVDEARAALDELVGMGCAFDRTTGGALDVHREAGQTVARSVHAADATGREIMRVVVGEARRRARRMVGTALALLVSDGRCAGVRVTTSHGEVDLLGRATLLAVGGCGALYEATTNPPTATGDALALAWDAGADIRDAEFVQFHPTALAVGGLRRVLLTEALRGDGAVVVDRSGKRFLLDVHPDGELAPRDVVARAVASVDEAFLDARPIGADAIRARFPNITAAVAEAGFDLTSEPVPIAPAAHYFLGGVATDVDGRTTLDGLFAAGECAATGVHGANRMAGNSLAEAVVFGRRAALTMAGAPAVPPRSLASGAGVLDEEGSPVVGSDPRSMALLRKAMTRWAGLVRNADSLERARDICEELGTMGPTDVRRAARAASLICRPALERTESRGVHFRDDHPDRDPSWDGRHVTVRSTSAPGGGQA